MERYTSELLSVLLEEEGGVPVISAIGELDIASTPELRAALLEAAERAGRGSGKAGGTSEGAGRPPVVVDLGGLSFMDSMGLGLLVESRKMFGELGIGLRLVAEPGSAARNLLETTALYDAFEVYRDRRAALEA